MSPLDRVKDQLWEAAWITAQVAMTLAAVGSPPHLAQIDAACRLASFISPEGLGICGSEALRIEYQQCLAEITGRKQPPVYL